MDAYWKHSAVQRRGVDGARHAPGHRAELPGLVLHRPVYKARARQWEKIAAVVVAQFRAACWEFPDDDGFRAVVEQARELSPEFAALWERRDIRPGGQLQKELEHPVVGTLRFESTQLRVPARPDLAIVLHTPAAGGHRHGGEAGVAELAGRPAGFDVPARRLSSVPLAAGRRSGGRGEGLALPEGRQPLRHRLEPAPCGLSSATRRRLRPCLRGSRPTGAATASRRRRPRHAVRRGCPAR
ncbi:hypothetical protein ACFSNO_33420 [Streptomyces cirratus]